MDHSPRRENPYFSLVFLIFFRQLNSEPQQKHWEIEPMSDAKSQKTKKNMDRMRELAAKAREDLIKNQEQLTERVEGFIIRPAIGSTRGAKRVGWELIHEESGYETYHRDREVAIGYIPKACDSILIRGLGRSEQKPC